KYRAGRSGCARAALRVTGVQTRLWSKKPHPFRPPRAVAGFATDSHQTGSFRKPGAVLMRRIVTMLVLLVLFFAGALFVMDWLWPDTASSRRPALTAVPPLEEVARSSMVVAPVAIAETAIRDALETQAPRNLTGQKDNPLSQLLSNADLGWT